MFLCRSTFRGGILGMVILITTGTVLGEGDKETVAARITRLIEQLGDDRFAQRETASKELERIGEPALSALRKAATSRDDPEIRRRAKQIIEAIAVFVTKRELQKLQGTWILVSRAEGGQVIHARGDSPTMTYSGNKWAWKHGNTVIQAGTWEVVAVDRTTTKYHGFVTEGANRGGQALGIFQFHGDQFRYCEGPSRPTSFTTRRGDRCYCCTWKRAKE